MSAIAARYDDTCPACWERVREGELIRRSADDTAWVHDTCPDDTNLTPTHPVCQTCWLTHPEGACDR